MIAKHFTIIFGTRLDLTTPEATHALQRCFNGMPLIHRASGMWYVKVVLICEDFGLATNKALAYNIRLGGFFTLASIRDNAWGDV